MGAFVVGAGFFLFIPRLWAGRTEWGANETKQFRMAAMTGFTTEVRLGDMVPLLENSKRVLQVSLFDPDGTPLDLERYCAESRLCRAPVSRRDDGNVRRRNLVGDRTRTDARFAPERHRTSPACGSRF